MTDTNPQIFHDQFKAIDHTMWLNFKHRISETKFGIISVPKGNFAVVEKVPNDVELPYLDILPKDYSDISYRRLDHIAMNKEPLPHWDELRGMVSVMDGEVLRFVLATKFSVEKLIRHELASRGFDKDHKWCGFPKAREIWLGEK